MSEIEPIETARRYDVVRASAPECDDAIALLKQLVMNGMADDWAPTGGIAVQLDPHGGASGGPRWTVLQAMIKYLG